MKRENVKFNITPSNIVKAWSKDGETVSVVSRSGVEKVKIEDALSENVILDIDRNIFEENAVQPMKDIVDDFEDGLQNIGSAFNAVLSELIACALSASLYGIFRIKRSQSLRVVELSSILRNIGKRRASQVVADIADAAIDGTYLLDLKGALLEAPQGTELLLGESPVFMLNPLGFVATFPLYAHGAVFIMPYAPDKAFCLYDSKAVKFRKTDGRILLSEDDVDKINACIVNGGRRFVTTVPEKYSPAYCVHTQDDIYVHDVETELSPVRILAKSVEFKSEEYRPFVYALRQYDESHSHADSDENTSGMLEDRMTFIIEYFGRHGV